MESYLVLLGRDTDVPVTQIAGPLSKVVDRPTVEITRQLRDRPWILLEDVPATALDAVFEVLAREEVLAKAIPEMHMPAMPEPLRLRYGEPLPRGLFLQRAAPPAPAVLPWSGLKIVSAGYLPVQPGESLGVELLHDTPGSAPMGAGRKREQDMLLVDIIGAHEEPLRLRIDAREFNYDYLGDRMLSSSRENVRLLIGDIQKRAPHARFTERTEKLVSGSATAEFRFRSLVAFETYNRWVLQAVEEEALEEAE
ncbi:MAG: hypothetical protein ACYS99_01925 [Planctomycetota bacterium]|jgi:hypothetical protein